MPLEYLLVGALAAGLGEAAYSLVTPLRAEPVNERAS